MRVWMVAAALVMLGCPGRYARPDDFRADPAPLFEALATRSEVVQSLTAQLSLEVWRGDERVRLRQLVALRRPDHLRIDSLSPFDQPLSTLVSDGDRLEIYSLEERRFYVGRASPENLARLLPVQLAPDELVALLRGDVPVTRHETAAVSWDADQGWYQLDLSGPEGRQRVHFEPKTRRVMAVQAWRGDTVRYIARFAEYGGDGPGAMPTRMRFEAPTRSIRVDVDVTGHRLNPNLPDAAFDLEPPRGVPVESLDR